MNPKGKTNPDSNKFLSKSTSSLQLLQFPFCRSEESHYGEASRRHRFRVCRLRKSRAFSIFFVPACEVLLSVAEVLRRLVSCPLTSSI